MKPLRMKMRWYHSINQETDIGGSGRVMRDDQEAQSQDKTRAGRWIDGKEGMSRDNKALR